MAYAIGRGLNAFSSSGYRPRVRLFFRSPMANADFYSYNETAAHDATPSTPSRLNLDWHYITTTRHLETEVARRLTCKALGIDTETTGLDPHSDRTRLVQVATPARPTLVIDLWKIDDVSALKTLFAGPALKVGHTLKFDWQMLATSGIPLHGPFFDAYLAHKVLHAGLKVKSGLSAIVKDLLGVDLDKAEQVSDFSRPELSHQQLQYAAWDAAYSLALRRPLAQRLKQASQHYHARFLHIANLESACVPATAMMELNGMALDPERFEQAVTAFRHQKQTALAQFHQALGLETKTQISLLPTEPQTFGINLASSQQVRKALAEQGLTLKATDQRTIIRVVDRHPALPHLLEWRHQAKVLDTLNSLPRHRHPVTQRLHPQVRQVSARSGRFSCRNPALQTVPHDNAIRRCFVVRPGHRLIKADYSQIELRIAAKITQDSLLVKAYRTGQDVHRMTAALLLDMAQTQVTREQRRLGKAINFGLIYGMSAARLQLEAQLQYGLILSHKDALALHQRYFQLFTGVAQWHRKGKRQLYRNDGIRHATTLLGRVRQWADKPDFAEWINAPVQGTCADMIKRALVALVPHLNADVHLLIVVHDEIVLEVRQDLAPAIAQTLTQVMIAAAQPLIAPIPIEVDTQIGHSWAGD
ncbi:DNA polymerase [Phormidium sp. FACHB-1136]|uniref:DNA polymerase n=1 Tax=Phormidium sp. FACHB-1136 TaxID=2692848 RepID=UPI001689109E|nr:DNA polymerase [Phormidium sp. FACHB-1136]MBD2429500.1 DNA-directed DNA polymerase [Phormidium sp. FACHB-1136]